MTVNAMTWALNQALDSDHRLVLSLMVLLAANRGDARLYRGNLVDVAVYSQLPLAAAQKAARALCTLHLLSAVPQGYRFELGALAA